MDNMGGICKLFLIDAEDFVSLDFDSENVGTLVLEETAEISEIEFTEDTGKFTETEEETDNGVLFNFEASIRVPRISAGNSERFTQLRDKKLMVLMADNNDQWILTGAPGSYFKISVSSTTGQNTADMNASTITISASLATGSAFINELP